MATAQKFLWQLKAFSQGLAIMNLPLQFLGGIIREIFSILMFKDKIWATSLVCPTELFWSGRPSSTCTVECGVKDICIVVYRCCAAMLS